MNTVGLVGAGNIGRTVAELSLRAGCEVALANSRHPSSLDQLVDELGPGARAASVTTVAAVSDVVVVAIPLHRYPDLPADAFDGSLVIDTGNYYPGRDGIIPELERETTTTSELVARHLPGARVVKALNNIFYQHLASLSRPADSAERTALPIAGDSEEAKTHAAALLDLLGYDSLDVGPLSEGWRYQRDEPAYVFGYGTPYQEPQPLDRQSLRALVDRALPYRQMDPDRLTRDIRGPR